MNFSRPILIEHELTISEEGLRDELEMAEGQIFSTNSEYVQNYVSVSFVLATSGVLAGNGENLFALVLFCDPDSDAGGRLRGTFSFFNKSANFVKHCSDVFFKGTENSRSFCQAGTDLLNPERKFIVNGRITFHMKGMLFREPFPLYYTKNISLVDCLLNRDDQDFVVSVGKENEPKTEIKIHKLVLASRSPVFDAMMKSGMKESIENKVHIIDFDAEVVQAAVAYFYDQDDYKFFDVEHLISLLQFTEKYDIQDLKIRISEELYKNLSPTKICQISSAAVLSNATELKDICFRFMIIYIKHEIPFNDAENLDKDFAFELFKKASMPFEDLLL